MGRHYERGCVLFDLGRYEGAIAEFTAELEENPRSTEAYGMRAMCHLKLNRFEECHDDASQAIGIDPYWSYSYYVLSVADLARGRLRRARGHILEAIRLLPSAAIYHFQLASVESARQQNDLALEATATALAIDPRHVDSLLLRSKLLGMSGRLDEAREVLERAIALQPESPATHQELGAVNLQQGAAERALEHLREARRIDPVRYNDRRLLAGAYGRLRWPFRQLDQLKAWLKGADIAWRWLLFNALFSLLVVTLLVTEPDLDRGKFSWVAAGVFGLAVNLILLIVTYPSLAAIVSLITLRRQLDLRRQHYVLAAIEFLAVVVITHGACTSIVAGMSGFPAFMYLVLCLVTLNWDWFRLLAPLKSIVAALVYPLLGVPFLVYAVAGSIWVPAYWETVLMHWSVVLVVSFGCMWFRRRLLVRKARRVNRLATA